MHPCSCSARTVVIIILLPFLCPCLDHIPEVAASLLRGRTTEEKGVGNLRRRRPPVPAMDTETGDTRSPLLPHHPPSQTQVTESPIPNPLLPPPPASHLSIRSISNPRYSSRVLLLLCLAERRKKERKLKTCCFLSPIPCFVSSFQCHSSQHDDFLFVPAGILSESAL